jgi:hypothetical protein
MGIHQNQNPSQNAQMYYQGSSSQSGQPRQQMTREQMIQHQQRMAASGGAQEGQMSQQQALQHQ